MQVKSPLSPLNPRPSTVARRIELPGSACNGLDNCTRTDLPPTSDPIEVSVILKRPAELKLPTGAFQPLDRAGFGKYDATAEQIARVKRFARHAGLKVSSVDPHTRTVKLEGTSAALGKAFGVRCGTYKDAGGVEFRSYEGKVGLPAWLADQVDGVFGLENRAFIRPRDVIPAQPRTGGYSPTQVATAYHFPKGTDGTGQTIGIIELGGGYKDADLKSFFAKWGIKAPAVSWVSVDGGKNAPTGNSNGPDGEVAMDIEVAGGVAPGARVVVYFAPNSEQGFIDAVNQATHDSQNKPNTLSISWGSAESHWTRQGTNNMNNAFKDAAALGINVFAASGDHGSADKLTDGKNHADFPASVPYGIGCGGTRLANGTEVAWNDGSVGASGGGVSDVYPESSWQRAGASVPAPTVAGGGRGVPDVAGNASPFTGYDVVVDGVDTTIGGTSAVAPLWAGLTARLGQGLGAPVGFLPPFLYRKDFAPDFRDITSGDNGGFKAGPGWDPVTGLGSPDGDKLLASLKQAHTTPLDHIA